MVKWLNRVTVLTPHIALCTNERSFRSALQHLKVPPSQCPKWNGPEHGASTHILDNPSRGEVACIVCIDPVALAKHKFTDNEIRTLLVHEAVHVKQALMDDIGEDKPSHEFEAYTVQSISLELMNEYDRQTKHGKAKRKLA